jgi:hypothetical protein
MRLVLDNLQAQQAKKELQGAEDVLPSSATQGLARNDLNLRALNQWYRHFAPQNGIATRTLFETRRTRFGWVVKPIRCCGSKDGKKMDYKDHCLRIGYIHTNLAALESALRFFLLKANKETFTSPNPEDTEPG